MGNAERECKFERKLGMGRFMQSCKEALGGINAAEVTRITMSRAHRLGYKVFFRGKTASEAARDAKMIGEEEKLGKVYESFTQHGLIQDESRLSTMASSIHFAYQNGQFNGLINLEDRKRKLFEIIDDNLKFMENNRVYEIPHATEVQQTKAFIDHEKVKSRKLGQ